MHASAKTTLNVVAEPGLNPAATCSFGHVIDHCTVWRGHYVNATLTLPAGQLGLPRRFSIDVYPGKWRHHARPRPGVADMPTVAVRQGGPDDTLPSCAVPTPARVPVFVVGAMWLRNYYHALLDFSFSLFATVRAALGYPFRSRFRVVLLGSTGGAARHQQRLREPFEPGGALSPWAQHMRWPAADGREAALCGSTSAPLHVGMVDNVSLCQLLLPELGGTATHDAVRSHATLRDYRLFLLAAVGLAPRVTATAAAPARVLLARRTGSRRLSNRAELLSALRAVLGARGGEVAEVELGSGELRPLRAQAEAVGGASALVGVHGAALSNVLFLRGGAALVQLVPSCFPRSHSSIGAFTWAAAALGGAALLARCRCACTLRPPEHNDLLEDCAAESLAELAARVAAAVAATSGPSPDAATATALLHDLWDLNVTSELGARRPCRWPPRPTLP